MIYRIRSRSNPRLKTLLQELKGSRYHLFEGEKIILDIIKRQQPIVSLILNENLEEEISSRLDQSVAGDIWWVSRTVLDKLSTLKNSVDWLALVECSQEIINLKHEKVVLVFADLQNPGNLGTALRCAAAFGIGAVFLTGSAIRLSNSKLLRAAQDAIFDVTIETVPSLETLVARLENGGFNLYFTSSHSARNPLQISDVCTPCAVVFGNEGRGLSDDWLARYPVLTVGQNAGVDSLNVAVSACIIMYEMGKTLKP